MRRSGASAVGALLVVVALVGCQAPPRATTAASAVPPAPVLPVAKDISTIGGLAFVSTPSPDWLLASPEGVWVANAGPGLQRLDADGTVTAEVPMSGDVVLGMESGFGSLWAADDDPLGRTRIVRVDLADPTRVRRAIVADGALHAESSIAVAAGRVWMIVEGGAGFDLESIDPTTMEVRTVRSFADGEADAGALRGGFGSLWLTSTASDRVLRLDPADGSTVAAITVGAGPRFLSVGRDAVWVMDQGAGAVSRIDPTSNHAAAPITVSDGPIDGGDIVATDTAVWVRTSAELASLIDPSTSRVVRRLGTDQGSGSVAVQGDDLWLSAHDVTTVWRLPSGANP